MSDGPEELRSSKLAYDDPDLPNILIEEEIASLAAKADGGTFDAEGWEAEGKYLSEQDTDVRWRLGKWLNEGYEAIGDWCMQPTMGHAGISFYSYASGITGWTTGHLKDLRSTEKRFSLSVRTDKLSYSHHRVLINTFPDASDEQLKGWLDTAIEKQMPVEEFQKELRLAKRGGGDGGGGKPPILEHNFIVTVPISVWETLKDLACAGSGQNEQQIAADIITEYCKQPDTLEAAKMYRKAAEEAAREARSEAGRRTAMAYDPLGLQR